MQGAGWASDSATRFVFDGRYVQDRFPGIGRYSHSLVRALATLLSHEELVVLHDPSSPNTRFTDVSPGQLPGVHVVPCHAHPLTVSEQWRVPRAVQRLAPTVIHAPYSLRPLAVPCPAVVSVHDLIPLLHPATMASPLRRLVFKIGVWLSCRTAAAILTPSEASRRDLTQILGVPGEKIHVTPYAAEERFHVRSPAEVERVRVRYGLAEQYVLYLGAYRPHKNLTRLVEAWARASRAEPRALRDVQLVLAGREERGSSHLRRRTHALGVSGTVVFAGEIAEVDMPALYSGATLFVLPSLSEGFGLPMLEAMACGAPVLCSNAPALLEVSGGAAVFADPLDVESWATALVRVLSDTHLRRDLARQSRARAAQFSWERTARQTLDAYRRVHAASVP